MGGFIPLGDVSRRHRRSSFVTLLLIAANAVVFFEELTGGDRFLMHWAAIPMFITHGRHTITLLTAMFLHAGWLHIIGNMVYLWAFGPEMEDAMGSPSFLLFYLLGGLVAMMAQVAATPFSRIPVIGASGAIAAVMGAFIVTFPRDRIRTVLFLLIFIRVTYIPAVFVIGFWFLLQIFNLGAVTSRHSGGVAYLAHVAGFVFGLASARLFVKKDPPMPAYWN
ncbi:MAG: rhomboid family intramembrane serine protease [Acidobacteriota bacterium]|nr:rhomboid family intramembrane serine protease [Acidobacteriota bacterium]